MCRKGKWEKEDREWEHGGKKHRVFNQAKISCGEYLENGDTKQACLHFEEKVCKPSNIGFDKMLGTGDGDEVQWVKLLLILHTHDTYKLTQALTPKHEKKWSENVEPGGSGARL